MKNLEVKKVSIQGPCKGVIGAIKKVNALLKDPNIKKPIYILGKLVHNVNISKAYHSKGIIILDGDKRSELIKKVSGGTVVITAHGVSDEIYQYLQQNNIDYLDCTCDFVLKTKKLIQKKLHEGYKILYLGVKNHPECEGVLSLSSDIELVEYGKNNNLSYLMDNTKTILISQTTLSYLDVNKIYEVLKTQIPNLELASEVCSATRLRQSALIREAQNYDLCLVVGDINSNNTKSLKEVCLKYTNTPAVLIEGVEDLVNIDFINKYKIIITSGASTPKIIVDKVCEVLENYENFINKTIICDIKPDEYIMYK